LYDEKEIAMPEFIPGLKLSEIYYHEAVRPILDQHFPGLAHAAALIGYGSDVLGFDTPVSRDHGWGPRLILFLPQENFESIRPQVNEALRQNLPVRIRGYSTHFGTPDPEDNGLRPVREIESGPVDHIIAIHTLTSFWQQELGADPFTPPSAADWLTFQEHNLLSVTAGQVYHDGLGLEEVRKRFAYYPEPLWRYLLAAQWALISQEEAFVGRTADVGDELGSRLVTARLAERLIRLCFLLEKRYAPYSKWFGTAFQRLDCYPQMGPLLEGATAANSYAEREPFIAQAYTLAVELQNALGITPPLVSQTRTYSGWHLLRAGVSEVSLSDPRNTRPHQVIFAERIAHAVYTTIADPEVLALIPYLGSINQFMCPASDALQHVAFCRGLVGNLRKDGVE
jgi:hypothetical protein